MSYFDDVVDFHKVVCQIEPTPRPSVPLRNRKELHRCLSCGYDGTRSSEVGSTRSSGAVEAERRQDQAEPCNTAPPTKLGRKEDVADGD